MTQNTHYRWTFGYVIGTGLLTFIYIWGVTFFHVPKENQRFVDIVLGVLLGTWLTGGMNYITGGSMNVPKRTVPPNGGASVDIQATVTPGPDNTEPTNNNNNNNNN